MDWSQVGVQIFQAFIPAIIAGIGYLGHRVDQWLKSKIHNDVTRTALDVLENITSMVVTRLEQTIVGELRDRSQGRSLTSADAAAIKNKAMEAIKSYYGPVGLEDLAKALKMTHESLACMIADKIEVAVYRLKYPGQEGLPVFRSGPPTVN